MARTINLRFPGKCAECGTRLPKGTKAKYYGRGRVYGLTCHSNDSEYKQPGGHCEDAPCCGCCGPQGDGDYYGTSAMEQAMEPYDDSPF